MATQAISWTDGLEPALARAQAEHRLVLLDFSAAPM
jgi:hypothetical protein